MESLVLYNIDENYLTCKGFDFTYKVDKNYRLIDLGEHNSVISNRDVIESAKWQFLAQSLHYSNPDNFKIIYKFYNISTTKLYTYIICDHRIVLFLKMDQHIYVLIPNRYE